MQMPPVHARRWLVLAALGLAVLVAVYAAPVGERTRTVAYAGITVALLVGATAAAFWRSRRSPSPDRLAWLLMGWATLSWAVGEASWEFLEVVVGRTPPTPHWTDIPYLLNVPLTVAAVLAFAWRPGTVAQTWSRVVDALFVASSLLTVAWIAFLGAAAANGTAQGLAAAVAIAYPSGDVLMLAAFALALVRLERDRLVQLWPLLAGLFVVAVADASYTWVLLQTGGYATSWFDLGWSLGAFGTLWAALRPGHPGRVRQGPAGTFEQWLPACVAALVVVAGSLELQRSGGLDRLTLLLALVTAGLLVARQALQTGIQLDLLRKLSQSQLLAGLSGWRWLRSRQLIDLGERGPALWGLPDHESAVPPGVLAARVHPDDRPRFEAAWSALLAGAADLDLTVRVPALSGEPQAQRHLQIRARRDQPLHGTFLDVTAQARLEAEQARADLHHAEAERLAELARAKTQFINTAAHELSTPLTPIRLSLATLRSRHTGPGDSLSILERNVDRLVRLLHDVLDGARLQSDRLRLDRRPMDLGDLARAVAEEHQPAASAHGQSLAVRVPGPVPVLGDATRLHEVLMNLLSNALKFTPAGGHIEVSAEADGNLARLQVRDDGRGIAAKDLGMLFQPFTQVGTPQPGGTGLGLYISRGIVERHGGTIRVESAGDGQGSCFTVEIPLAVATIVPAP